MELIETLIRIFSTMLGIKENIVCLSKKQMLSLYSSGSTKLEKQKEEKELNDVFGSCYPEDACFYLNPKFTKRSYQTLCDTIVHELLHIKYPNKKEAEILNLERENTGRFDYVIKSDLKHYKKCKVIKFG